MGEWMKLLGDPDPSARWVEVVFRGGRGFVKAKELSPDRHLEVFFIDVDQGDSTLIQTPDDRRILIDGGKTRDALEFITNKYRLDKKGNYIDFEAIVATHSDEDHAKGLIPILEHPKIAVKRVYHNGLFRRKTGPDPGPRIGDYVGGLVSRRPGDAEIPKLKKLMQDFVAAVDSAQQSLPAKLAAMKELSRWKKRVDFNPRNFVFSRLDAAVGHLPPFDSANDYLKVEILWPMATKQSGKWALPWYGSVGKTVNGNSIVLRLVHGEQVILLAGDLNEPSMDAMLTTYASRPEALLAGVYKAAHHGSQHFSLPFLKTVKPDAAVISSGDDRYDQHGHPRAVLMGTVTRYSRCARPAVFSTELARCYRRLTKNDRRDFKKGIPGSYERALEGIVHLRSNGRELHLGTVHGRKAPSDKQALTTWKWDVWPD
jgi:beta-lactamase superfamily II metal-dependent hydrolase